MKKVVLSVLFSVLLISAVLAALMGPRVIYEADPGGGMPGETISKVTLYLLDPSIVWGAASGGGPAVFSPEAVFGPGIKCGNMTPVAPYPPYLTFEVSNVTIDASAIPGYRMISIEAFSPVLGAKATWAKGYCFGVGNSALKIAKSETSPDPLYMPQAALGLSFPTERIGYAVGPWNACWKTTDRGVTWTKGTIASGYDTDLADYLFSCVQFLDTQTGFAGGTYIDYSVGLSSAVPVIFKTTDGGSSWTRLTIADYTAGTAIVDLYFADASNGWAVNSYFGMGGATKNFFRTANGGATWSTGDISPFGLKGSKVTAKKGMLSYISAIGLSAVPNGSGKFDVWVTGAPWSWSGDNILFKSTDSGSTWAAVNSPAFSSPADGKVVTVGTDVDFVDANTGYLTAVGINGMTPIVPALFGKAFKTTDGGATWTEVVAGYPALLGVDFADASNGAVVGVYGTVLRTADGGNTWSQYWRDIRHLRGIVYKDENNAWACGGTQLPGIPLLWSGNLKSPPGGGPVIIITLGYNAGKTPSINSLTTKAFTGSGGGDYDPISSPEDGTIVMKYVVNPAVSGVTPGQGAQGDSGLALTITGGNLQAGGTVGLGSGITAGTPALTGDSSNTAAFYANIDSAATLGGRDITWTNEDKGSTVVSSGFVVVTSTAAPTTTVPGGAPKLTIKDVTPSKETLGSGLDIVLYLETTITPTKVILTSTLTGRTMTFTSFTYRDGVLTLPSIPFSELKSTDVGYWRVTVEGPGVSALADKPILIDLGGDGNVVVTPNSMTTQTFRALAAGETPSRMAYTLAQNRVVHVYISELKTGTPVYHRLYASGTAGGTVGYNEQVLTLKGDNGIDLPNGAYLIQVVGDGKVIGNTKFVVNK
jgi:photosystem II stability/assembly factor-like uncharacterized protein